jgi:hypothetical protein
LPQKSKKNRKQKRRNTHNHSMGIKPHKQPSRSITTATSTSTKDNKHNNKTRHKEAAILGAALGSSIRVLVLQQAQSPYWKLVPLQIKGECNKAPHRCYCPAHFFELHQQTFCTPKTERSKTLALLESMASEQTKLVQ